MSLHSFWSELETFIGLKSMKINVNDLKLNPMLSGQRDRAILYGAFFFHAGSLVSITSPIWSLEYNQEQPSYTKIGTGSMHCQVLPYNHKLINNLF